MGLDKPQHSAQEIDRVEAETKDEIAEIMSEIEELQEGIAQASQPGSEPTAEVVAEPALEDFGGGGGDAPMEEILAALKVEEAENGVFENEANEDSKMAAVPMKTRKSLEGAEEGNLTLKLSGKMTLTLQYECEGQELNVSFEEGCLFLRMADGTEFKVPLKRGESGPKLKAA